MKTKPLVILTSQFHPETIRTDLEPHARVVIVNNKAALQKRLPEAAALITLLSDRVDEDLLLHAGKLKVVGNYAVGTNNIDLSACTKRGIKVVNTPRVLTRATAELAAALLLASARRLPEGDSMCRAGRFKGWGPSLLLGLELKGRQAVILGKGRIGIETGRIFRALGLKVEWITREDSPRTITAKLKRAQVLSLHVPLTENTHHWLDRKRIRLLPRDSIVINTARGPVVDEAALTDALIKRKIFAAGFDVYENEPKIPRALLDAPNTVLLPHIGSATTETRRAMAQLVISGVLSVLNGKTPPNLIKS